MHQRAVCGEGGESAQHARYRFGASTRAWPCATSSNGASGRSCSPAARWRPCRRWRLSCKRARPPSACRARGLRGNGNGSRPRRQGRFPRAGSAGTGSDFRYMLENTHVIGPQQIWAGVIPVGPAGIALNSSFKMRGSNEYRNELGNAIGPQRMSRASGRSASARRRANSLAGPEAVPNTPRPVTSKRVSNCTGRRPRVLPVVCGDGRLHPGVAGPGTVSRTTTAVLAARRPRA